MYLVDFVTPKHDNNFEKLVFMLFTFNDRK